MCGIFCVFDKYSRLKNSKKVINYAFESMKHRGPDFQRLIFKNDWIIGHARLSIIDTSDFANQPFTKDNRHYLIFNGEIYNFKKLRKKIINDETLFTTNSDTEVLYNLLVKYGVEKTLKYLKGMFSFVFIDLKKNTLVGARDHFGQKPFYYFNDGSIFAISSEIKSLNILKNSNLPDLNIWRTYLCSNGIINENKTFFENILTLPAGSSIKFKENKITTKKYFDVIDLYKGRSNFDRQLNICETISKLDFFISKSIKSHLISDVPIGILLSGGIDSSLIHYYAMKLDNQLTAYTKISPSIEKIPLKIIPKLFKKNPSNCRFLLQDKKKYLKDSIEFVEHTCSPARWGGGPPMSNLCKSAYSDGIKVLLGGDGVDEMALGYNSHNVLFKKFDGNMHTFHDLISLNENSQFYDKNKLESYLNDRHLEKKFFFDIDLGIKNKKEIFMKSIIYQDLSFFLQACNLPHSDAFSMKESIELRNPFLDLDLVEFVINQRMNFLLNDEVKDFGNKFIFRELAKEKIGKFINVKKEGTRNYSMFISNNQFWKIKNFKLNDLFPVKSEMTEKEFFKYLNLEILYRKFFLKDNDYITSLLTKKGLISNDV